MKTNELLTEKKVETIEALNYIADVFNKQGFIIDCRVLFGDGSRWKNLKYSGFETVYKVVLAELQRQAPQTT